jgi:hypothetical protein
MASNKFGAVDLSKETAEERREKIMERISAIQKILDCELKVTLYKADLHTDTTFSNIIDGLRLSEVKFDHADETYGVHIVANGIGEIPYPLNLLDTFELGKEPEKNFVPEHTLAAAALASATVRLLPVEKLQEFIDRARGKGAINDEQYILIYKHFLDEELQDDQA